MNLTEIKNRLVGISCAHVDTSGNVVTKCYGLSDMEDNKAVDENTIFPACSISKFVTAFCIMRLNEQGLIDIDKPVNDYLKDWKLLTSEGGESVAPIRTLLNHTAGIFDGEDAFYGLRRSDTSVSLLDILEGRTSYNNRPARAKNTSEMNFEYSDAGYCVLQQMLQDKLNKTFDDIARELVFNPLGLNSTFFASPENVDLFESKGIMATGYDEKGEAIPGKYPYVPDLAASGLWSTPTELLKIAGELAKAINGKSTLLKKESAEVMVKPDEKFSWIGLGLFMGGENEVVSSGWGENGQCKLKVNYRTGEASVVMANRNPGVDQSESGIEWLLNNGFTRE